MNPVRLQGQKTAAFEIVDFLGDAPDVHLLPVGNAGNISAYWLGYEQYAALGRATRKPRMRGFQAEGAAPLVTGEPFPDPETKATAIRVGNPASWKLAEAARRRVRRPVPGASATTQILAAQRRARAPRRASSSSRPRPPASPGCWPTSSAGRVVRRHTVVVTVTGHGLKDTATALESASGDLVDAVVDADVEQAAAAAGLPVTTFVDGPVRVTVPATSANLGPGFDSLGLALDLRDELDRRGRRRRAWSSRCSGEGAGRRVARRVAPGGTGDARGLRRDRVSSRPGLRLTCTNRIPHARGLGSSSAAIVGGIALARALVVGGRQRMDDDGAVRARRRPRGASRQRRPGPAGGLRDHRRDGDGVLGRPAAGRPAGPRGRLRAADAAVHRGRARPAARPTVPHADAAANAGRAALLVAALGTSPSACSGPPRTSCTRTTARPAMPDSLDLRRPRCGPTATRPSSPAPARRCSCSPPTAPTSRRTPRRLGCRPLPVAGDGVRIA